MFYNKRLVNIISELFGFPRRYTHGQVEVEYNCPHCDNDRNKFNLVVNTDKFVFHCWACGYKGSIKKLVRDFGTESQSKKLDSVLFNTTPINTKDEEQEEELYLSSFRSLKVPWKDSLNYVAAMKYLRSRKIDKDLINKWDICYSETGKYSNRIIIPSKTESGKVEYFIARDFFGTSKLKYKNPRSKKSTVIFGEKFIDWKKPVILTEGVFDAIVLYNAVPILGTNVRGNTKLLSKIQKNKTPIIMGFDSDDVGVKKSVEIAKHLLNFGIPIYSICDNEYKDLAEAYVEKGNKYIIELIRNAKQFDELDMLIQTIK